MSEHQRLSDINSTTTDVEDDDGDSDGDMLLFSTTTTRRRRCSPPPTCSHSTSTTTTTTTRIMATKRRQQQRRRRIMNTTTNALFILATLSFWCSSPSSSPVFPPNLNLLLYVDGSDIPVDVNAADSLDSQYDDEILSEAQEEQTHEYIQYHEQQEQEMRHEEEVVVVEEEHDDDTATAVPDPTKSGRNIRNSNIGVVESSPERNNILSEHGDDDLDLDLGEDVESNNDAVSTEEEEESYGRDESQQYQQQHHHQQQQDEEIPPVEDGREEVTINQDEGTIAAESGTNIKAVDDTAEEVITDNEDHRHVEVEQQHVEQQHRHDASQRQEDYLDVNVDSSETILEDLDEQAHAASNDGGENGDENANEHVHEDESSHSYDGAGENEGHETPEDDGLPRDDEASRQQQDNSQYSDEGDNNMMGSNDDDDNLEEENDHSSPADANFVAEDESMDDGAQQHGDGEIDTDAEVRNEEMDPSTTIDEEQNVQDPPKPSPEKEETIDFDSSEATSADYVDRQTDDEQPNKEGATKMEEEKDAPTNDGAETDKEAAEETPKEGSLASFMENAKNKNSQKGSAFEQQQQQKVRQNEFERQYHGQFQQQQQQQQMPPPGGQQRQSSASAAAKAKESYSANTQPETAQGTSEESQTTSAQEDHEYSGEPWGLYRVRRRMPDLNLLYLLFQDLMTGGPDQRKAAMDEAAKHDLDDIRQYLENDPLYDREVVETTMRKSDAAQQRTQVICDEEGCKEISYDERNDEQSSSDDSTGPATGDMEDAVGSSDDNTDTDFVEGLDDIDKFFEPVDPQFVDVGASGFSMQEVIMGQGRRIIIKKAQQAVSFSRRAIGSLRRRAVRQWEKIQRATNPDQNEDNVDDRRAKSKDAGADFESSESDDDGFNWNVVRREVSKVWNFGEELMERVVDWVDDMFNGGSSEDDDFDTFEKLDLSNLANTNMAGGADAAP